MFVKNGNTVSTSNAAALANALKSSHGLLQIDLVNAMLQSAGVPSFCTCCGIDSTCYRVDAALLMKAPVPWLTC